MIKCKKTNKNWFSKNQRKATEFETKLSETVVRWCSVKKVFFEISQNSQENSCAKVSFLIKLHALACNFIKKETLAQVFSCEFSEISKNTFCYRTPLVAASELLNQFWFLSNIILRKNIKIITSQLNIMLMKIIPFLSYYVCKKLTWIPMT